MDMRWKPNAVVEVTVTPACPRCGSSNTKFCYYNNYSLTQPRYFCKGCRRYWTKGGSLRNVPVGGGCRKRRRGKSLRGSSSTGSVPSSRSYSGHGAMLDSSGSYRGQGHVSTSIDLAAVYANFLNQKPQLEAPQVEVPELLYDGIPSFDYAATGLGQESEFAILSDKSSEIRLGEENTRYFRGINSFDPKHQYANDDQLITNMNSLMMNNSSLPPLPGEDVSTSEGMEGSSFHLMLPNHIFQSTDQIEQDPQQLNVGDGNPFRMLNLEAIFRP